MINLSNQEQDNACQNDYSTYHRCKLDSRKDDSALQKNDRDAEERNQADVRVECVVEGKARKFPQRLPEESSPGYTETSKEARTEKKRVIRVC